VQLLAVLIAALQLLCPMKLQAYYVFVIDLCTVNCGVFVVDLALKIHLSKAAYDSVQAFPEFITECRDDICDEVVINSFLCHYALNRLLNEEQWIKDLFDCPQ